MGTKKRIYYLSISFVVLLLSFLMEPKKLVQADTSIDSRLEDKIVLRPAAANPPTKKDTYPVMLNTNGPGTALLQGNQVFYNDGFAKGNGLWTFTYGKENSKKTITKDATSLMNIQGDWIYYVVPNYTGTFGSKNPIKKVKKTGRSKPITITTDFQIEEMVVNQGWIYYVSYNYQKMKVTLNRIKTNGTNKKVLLESYEPYSNVAKSKKGYIKDIHIRQGYIYFLRSNTCGYGRDCSQIYRMKTDGTSMVSLNKTEYAVRMQIANGKIYYSRFPEDLRDDSKNSVPIDLYSMGLNGKNPTLISKNITGYDLYFIEEFKVHGDWIYFALWDKVYKMRTDGSSVTVLVNDVSSASNFNVVGEWVYFRTPSSALRVRTNGQNFKSLHW
ncbi:DUF5050 domain-containing protein [Peribacillus asahii]|uniref:DUF5050 domain-containing protein n=1 Tax=Peribacillus asahii TaxID=228899 RepID=UPI0038010BF7